MEILFEVSSRDAARVFVPLAEACNRNGMSWGCFFTGDGVLNLADEDVAEVAAKAVTAIVCEHSWELHMSERACPVKLGSQTNNSTLVGDTARVVSL